MLPASFWNATASVDALIQNNRQVIRQTKLDLKCDLRDLLLFEPHTCVEINQPVDKDSCVRENRRTIEETHLLLAELEGDVVPASLPPQRGSNDGDAMNLDPLSHTHSPGMDARMARGSRMAGAGHVRVGGGGGTRYCSGHPLSKYDVNSPRNRLQPRCSRLNGGGKSDHPAPRQPSPPLRNAWGTTSGSGSARSPASPPRRPPTAAGVARQRSVGRGSGKGGTGSEGKVSTAIWRSKRDAAGNGERRGSKKEASRLASLRTSTGDRKASTAVPSASSANAAKPARKVVVVGVKPSGGPGQSSSGASKPVDGTRAWAPLR